MTENEIGTIVVGASIKVHQHVGPGLLESVYQRVLIYELEKVGLSIQHEAPITITYDGVKFDEGYRADIIVEDKVVLELKSVEHILPVHMKQLLTYLKLSDYKLGYLLNFGDVLMKQGIKRAVNGLEEEVV